MPRRWLSTFALVAAVVGSALAALSPEVERALRESKYVYIQSERKSAELGRPAEIWYYWDGHAAYVGTRPASWRVRRIKAGRTRARIAAGKPDGPAFDATGTLVRDPAIEAKLMAEFARKYPDRWPQHAEGFRKGFASGERVLVRYTPR
jgi:hypothetical protein